MKKLIILIFLSIFIWIGCAAKNQEQKPTAAESSSEARMKALFPQNDSSLPDWKIRDKVLVFNKKTIFDHINGAAEAYLARGFVLCGSAEYNPVGDSSSDEFILIDIYDMDNPDQALDMYKSELYPDVKPLVIDVQGYVESSAIIFWKERYYVKIIASSEEQEIAKASMKLAEYVAGNISEKS